MSELLQSTVRNQLLSRLSADDFGLLAAHLSRVPLALGETLEEPDQPIGSVVFMEHGVSSVVAITPGGERVEAGLLGWEGMTGLAVIHHADRSPNQTFVQAAGEGLRIGVADFERALNESRSLQGLCLRFAQTFTIQLAYTALANARYSLVKRLARWLLMSHDRRDGDDLPLKHEFLSLMLGVRRPGVTEAVQDLEGKGLIAARRGWITVLDRAGLEAAAGGCYGTPEAEYRRLIGPLRDAPASRPPEQPFAG